MGKGYESNTKLSINMNFFVIRKQNKQRGMLAKSDAGDKKKKREEKNFGWIWVERHERVASC